MHKWETLEPGMTRMEVPGGWLYRYEGVGKDTMCFVSHPPIYTNGTMVPLESYRSTD